VGRTKAYRIYFKDSAYKTNYYRIYGVRHYKKYTIDAVLGKVDSFLYEDKLPIGGTEVCFLRNSYNNYTTKEILFSDEIINGTESMLEFYETLPRSVSNSIVLYQIDIYLENVDVNTKKVKSKKAKSTRGVISTRVLCFLALFLLSPPPPLCCISDIVFVINFQGHSLVP
jgi:hypothetical protein